MTQAHIIFSGTVQGIGFRYATQRMASELGLTGWVRNLKSGNVEILAEGRKEDIEHLTAELNRHFNGYIQDSKITYQTAEGSFLDFRIVF